jgi:hypothetical protein
MVTATLQQRSWLKRVLKVTTPEGIFTVEYNGRGIGFETVYVNGVNAIRRRSGLWFVPRFEFFLGSYAAELEVHVSLWLTITELRLWVEKGLIYQDNGELT